MISYSVIIVTYNSASTIAECLRSVAVSEMGHEVETIVVDNASSDQTKQILKEQFPGTTLIENSSNAGFSAGVNQGAGASTKSHFILLNPDTVVEERFFAKCSDFFAAKPTAAILGPNLVDANGRHQASCWKKPTLLTTLVEMLLPYKMSIEIITDNPAITSEVSMVSGACLVVRRDVFERMKGMDEQFFMYYEDADLCFRTRKDGYHIFYHPSVNVYHKISGSGGNAEILTVEYYKSKVRFFRKHYPGWYALAVRVIVALGIVVRIPAYFIVGGILFNRNLLELWKLYLHVVKRLPDILSRLPSVP